MTGATAPITLADDLLIGAPELTRFIFGRDGRTERRRFYHLASTGNLPGVFKMRGLWAGRKSKILTLGAA